MNDFIYVPLGEALILRENIYHAGNYGSVGNTRFHAMIKPKEQKVLTQKLRFLPSSVCEENICLTSYILLISIISRYYNWSIIN